MSIVFETKRGLSVLISRVCLLLTMTLASQAAESTNKGSINLTSSAFGEGAPIPEPYTCEGKNVSPPLKWSGVPSETKSLALIVDDPDASIGTWVHWVVFDIPPTTSELPQDVTKSQFISGGAKQGLNDFKHLGYGGLVRPPANRTAIFSNFMPSIVSWI